MPYYTDFRSLRLEEIARRLSGADLIPSQVPLLDGLASKLRALRSAGIGTLEDLVRILRAKGGPATVSARTGLPAARIEELARLADLSRIPYVGATYARAILEAGCRSVGEVARADPEVLDAAIQAANVRLNLYRTRIGSRDIRRLIRMAGELED